MIRTRRGLYSLTLAALALTVPWFFPAGSSWRLWGIPAWALYAVGASVLYAALIAWAIGRFWELSAGGDGEDEDA